MYISAIILIALIVGAYATYNLLSTSPESNPKTTSEQPAIPNSSPASTTSGATANSSPNPTSKTVNIADFAGNPVALSVPIRTVVVLEPYIATYIYALNSENTIVGRSNTTEWPIDILKVPDVGGGSSSSVSAELILQLKPDLVIGSVRDTATLEAFQQANIPIFQIYSTPSTSDPHNETSVILKGAELVNTLGTIFGKEQRASDIANYITSQANLISSRIETLVRNQKPLVFFEVFQPYQTLVTPYIHQTGGINIAENETFYYPTMSAESVVQQSPDIIIQFISSATHNQADFEAAQQSVLSRPELTSCNAILKKQVYIMDWAAEGGGGNLFDIVGYLQWAKWIQPALFSDINPMDVQTHICNTWLGSVERAGTYWYPS